MGVTGQRIREGDEWWVMTMMNQRVRERNDWQLHSLRSRAQACRRPGEETRAKRSSYREAAVSQLERSPDQGLPEEDVPPVTSIAVVVVAVVADHPRLSIQLAHHTLAQVLGLKVAEQGRAAWRVAFWSASSTGNQLGPSMPARNITAAMGAPKRAKLRSLSPAPLPVPLPPPLPARRSMRLQ